MSSQIIQGVKGMLYGTKNLILRATGESLKPKMLVFEVTDRCNSRCKHCNIWQREPTKDALTPKEIERMLSDPLFSEVECILNTGGEPTLRDDLEEVLFAEHKALPKTRLQLSTNGLLPERIISIVKSAIKHDINIDVGTSLDGVGEKHDFIRGVRGNFEKVDQLLHELTALRENHRDKLQIAVGMVLSDHTLPSLQEVRTYLQEFDMKPLMQWYNEASYYSNVGRKLAESEDLIKAVQSLPYSPVSEAWLKSLRGKSIKFPCFAMYTFCLLHCNGDIAPCLRFSNVRVGNVRESPPSLIWHSPEAKRARRIVKDCYGCLNDWGVSWSFTCSFYQLLFFYLKNPRILIKKLREK